MLNMTRDIFRIDIDELGNVVRLDSSEDWLWFIFNNNNISENFQLDYYPIFVVTILISIFLLIFFLIKKKVL
jgi:hypothetical protein